MATTKCLADIPGVVQLNHDGAIYYIIELKEIKKGKYKYKLLDCEYPLVISKEEYKANEKLLKNVTDNRPYSVKHPWLTRISIACNIGNVALNILGICKL